MTCALPHVAIVIGIAVWVIGLVVLAICDRRRDRRTATAARYRGYAECHTGYQPIGPPPSRPPHRR